MYLGVDIGGTKVLVATLDDNGAIVESCKFPTPETYDQFLQELQTNVATFTTKDFAAVGIGIPGRLDRGAGRIIELGNLPWKDKAIRDDVAARFNCSVVIENDANMAGLSEAQLHKDSQTVLYLTISTGIGSAMLYDQHLDPMTIDSEGGHILLPHDGKVEEWESFASGRAIFERFGKKAADITDPHDWKLIVDNLVLGFHAHMALIQPDLIIIGGSIGTYFERYSDILVKALRQYNEALVPTPPIIQAKRPEEAVIFGCYDLIKQSHAADAH